MVVSLNRTKKIKNITICYIFSININFEECKERVESSNIQKILTVEPKDIRRKKEPPIVLAKQLWTVLLLNCKCSGMS